MSALIALVASWTDGVHGAGGNGGIRSFTVDQATGALHELAAFAPTVNAGYMALNSDATRVYLLDERKDIVGGTGAGSVLTLALEHDGWTFAELGRVSSIGPNPSHVALDPAGDVAVVSNHGNAHQAAVRITEVDGTAAVHLEHDDGTFVLFAVGPDGVLQPAGQVIVTDAGSGPVPSHQRSPHPHSSAFDPTGTVLVTCDKGADRVELYAYDRGAPVNARLARTDTHHARPGSAPRHVAFHPSAPVFYVVDELDSAVEVYHFDRDAGTVAHRQCVRTMDEPNNPDNHPSDVVVHPSGRAVYAANRVGNTVASFTVADDGRLTPLNSVPCGGHRPRGIALTPDGRWLYVANTDTDAVTAIVVDPDSGALGEAQSATFVPRPACIRFISA